MANKYLVKLSTAKRNTLRVTRKVIRKALNSYFDFRYSGSFIYMLRLLRTSYHSGYDMVRDLFDHVSVHSNDVIVEIGCGMGRVIGLLAFIYPNNNIIGVERDDTVMIAKKYFGKHKRIDIEQGDFKDRFPTQGTIFYLFSPSSGDLLFALKQHIDDYRMSGTVVVATGALENIKHYYNDESWSVQVISPPKKFWKRFISTWYVNNLGWDGMPYGVIMTKN